MTGMTALTQLEHEAIYIIREAVAEAERPVMLYSIGKDSSVMLHLALKAFYRIENIRRIGEVAKLMTDAGLIVITAFISPFRTDRDTVRALMPEREFIEIHLATPLDVCENRDPKGLYRKARRGEIPNLTGVSSPYEEPLRPELRLDTTSRSARECTDDIMVLLRQNGFC